MFFPIERNLDPKTACLKRREEEKNEQTVNPRFMNPQLGGQLPAPNVVIPPPGAQQISGSGGPMSAGQIPHMMNTGQNHQPPMMMPHQNMENHGLVLDSLS